jgi:hypothetical protein
MSEAIGRIAGAPAWHGGIATIDSSMRQTIGGKRDSSFNMYSWDHDCAGELFGASLDYL